MLSNRLNSLDAIAGKQRINPVDQWANQALPGLTPGGKWCLPPLLPKFHPIRAGVNTLSIMVGLHYIIMFEYSEIAELLPILVPGAISALLFLGLLVKVGKDMFSSGSKQKNC